MISAILFVIAAGCIFLAAIVGMLAQTYIYFLSGGRALARDGLPRGSVAPTWALTDTAGKMVCSPPVNNPLQLIVFTDHSLKSFPSLAAGLRTLLITDRQLEIVVLMRRPSDLAKRVLQLLDLSELPVLTGSSKLYGKYNVRVIPFGIFVDLDGRVRASSLINDAWQIDKLWQLASVVPGADELRVGKRGHRRLAGAGV